MAYGDTVPETFDGTPWFSRDEWREVYENVIGNSAEKWKFALHKILVWKARVPNLPVGIETTIPLLLGQMALCHPSMSYLYKNCIIDWAIARFVTMATKGHSGAGTTMHNLASKIDLPQYLVDFRHQTSHTYSIFGFSHTRQTALRISLEWIKVVYWDDEAKNLEELKDTRLNKNYKAVDEKSDQSLECINFTKNIVKLHRMIFKDKSLITVEDLVAKPVKENMKNIGSVSSNKILKILCNAFPKYFKKNPNNCIRIFVQELFYSRKMKNLAADGTNLKACKKCQRCTSEIPWPILCFLSPLIEIMLRNGALDRLFGALLDSSQDCPRLCSQWLRVFVNSFFMKRGYCSHHRFQLKRSKSFHKIVKWKKLLFHLFSMDQPWCVALARLISVAIGLSEDKISQINVLHSIYSTTSTKKKDISDETDFDTTCSGLEVNSETVKNINCLKIEALKVSTGVHSYVDVLSQSSTISNCPVNGEGKNKYNGHCPLGLLPHQIGDSSFLQQLRLSSYNTA